jgi:hypothetical protein
MMNRYLLPLAAMTSAAFLTGSALAADAGHTVGQMQNNPNPAVTAPQGNTVDAPQSVGGSQRMDNTNAAANPLDAWMSDYAAAHNGRITREEFLDQMGNRWDAVDTQRQGYLTPDEARDIFTAHPGEAAGATPPRTGADVNPGYMGPGSVKGK